MLVYCSLCIFCVFSETDVLFVSDLGDVRMLLMNVQHWGAILDVFFYWQSDF